MICATLVETSEIIFILCSEILDHRELASLIVSKVNILIAFAGSEECCNFFFSSFTEEGSNNALTLLRICTIE